MGKVLKYQSYLDKYKNCPKDCKEKDMTAYRWVHNPIIEKDFEPYLLNSEPPVRLLGADDQLCTGYALSLYKDAKSAIKVYIDKYNKQDREKKRIKYIERLGDSTAKLNITKDDGISDNPKYDGHFNFFEYKECNLLKSVSEILHNFAKDGAD